MGKLQRMIDTNRLRTDVPVDVTQLMATGLFVIKPMEKEGGIWLQDDVRNFSSPFMRTLLHMQTNTHMQENR